MLATKLIVNQPGKRSRSVELSGSVVSIGRRPDNVICLNDPSISKYHAVIERRDDAYWVTDLGSSNGTTVNGQRLTGARALQDNDLICLGGTSTLQFHHAAGERGERRSVPPFSAPSAPTLSAPTAAAGLQFPQASPPQPSVPPPPPAALRVLGMPRAAALALCGLLAAGGLAGALWATGFIGGGSGARAARDKVELGQAQAGGATPDDPAAPAGESSAGGALGESASTQEVASDGAAGARPGAGADATAALARTLAVQISQKSSYHFDPGFVALINSYVNEYRAAAGYYERAGKYREAIDREFVNVQGIQPPLIAYVTAMSQTKFVERGGEGVWNLPPQVVRAYSAGGADAGDPAASTRVAAAYIRSLLDLFEKENFMYAVACYGMTLDEAGKVRVALEGKDPGGQQRADFWKMKNAGVVSGPQVERVARFFAAGIVCEYPAQFGLKEKPLSSLY